MRAWQIPSFGQLTLEDVAPPDPGPGELVLEVAAASLNYRDFLVTHGGYNPRQPLPLVPGSDCCGHVVQAGEGTTTPIGSRVMPSFSTTWLDGPLTDAGRFGTLGSPLPGVLQERIVVPEACVVAVPEHLTDAEAACLPCAGVTAWRGLVTDGRIAAGDAVLTLGTGGVSLFALQLATAMGAEVAITSSSDAKLARMRELGAAFTLNYTDTPKWGRAIRAWRPADVVLELGGAGTLAQSLDAVATGGHIALIGVLDGAIADVPLTKILMRAVRVQGVMVGSRQDLVDLCAFLTAHPDLRPVVDRTVPFHSVRDTLLSFASDGHVGKVTVSF